MKRIIIIAALGLGLLSCKDGSTERPLTWDDVDYPEPWATTENSNMSELEKFRLKSEWAKVINELKDRQFEIDRLKAKIEEMKK